jgi:trk system potassium uptake protein TrkA
MTQPEPTPLYFIIGGGGRVGYFLAKSLLEENHEVVLLEKDPRRVFELRRELGDVVERGDACEVSVLDRIGCERADYLLAVTGEDEDNLVMCQVAKAGFPPKDDRKRRTIARVNNIANIGLFTQLGIDTVVSPTQNILDAIGTELPLPTIIQHSPPTNKGKQLIEVHVPPDTPAKGKTLQELLSPNGVVMMLIRGQQNFVQPDVHMQLQGEDRLFILVTPEGFALVQSMLMGDRQML